MYSIYDIDKNNPSAPKLK